MTELGGIVGIYGAIDQVAQTDSDTRAAVSQLLPLYRDPELHWYDDFQEWLRKGKAKARGPLFPSLEDALDQLAGIEPHCRMRPRRLFAIAVAMQAFPKMRNPDSPLGTLAVDALRVGTLAKKRDEAQALHGLLAEGAPRLSLEAGSEELSTWWADLINIAHTQGLISSTAGMLPRPCSGRLLSMQGVAGSIAALETEFETDEIDFDRATRFLEPANWPACMPWFWCEMKLLNAGSQAGVSLYREVVSTDCPDKPSAIFTAETELDFEFEWLPDSANQQAALTNYRLAPGRPRPGDLIRVDEGSLVVEKTGAGPRPLRVTTTKRIQFTYPFSSQALAMIMCALGYTDVVGNLLCCAASDPERDGKPFPGGANQVNPPDRDGCRGIATALSDCIEECATAAGDWSRRVAEGPYTTDELAQDVASTWTRVLRKGSTAVELGARPTQTGTRTGTRERSED